MTTKDVRCNECDDLIPAKRIELVPNAEYCTACQEKVGDTFKYKMKTVGFSDEPTIARTKDQWEILKKQKKVRDI